MEKIKALPKVYNSKKYTLPGGKQITAVEGRIALIKIDDYSVYSVQKDRNGNLYNADFKSSFEDTFGNLQRYQPIIISETEKKEVGDKVLHQDKEILTLLDTDEFCGFEEDGGKGTVRISACKKILTLPENFTRHQLQAIVEGELKDGEQILVQCNEERLCALEDMDIEGDDHDNVYHYIKLDPKVTIIDYQSESIYLVTMDGHRDSVNFGNYATNEQEIKKLISLEEETVGRKVDMDSFVIDFNKKIVKYKAAEFFDPTDIGEYQYSFFILTKVQ